MISLLLLLLVSVLAQDRSIAGLGIELGGDTLCNAPTCEYFHNFQRVVSMMYTDDDGQPHQADLSPAGKVFVPELSNDVEGGDLFIIPTADFISHGIIVLDGFQRVVHSINNMVPTPTIEVFQDAEIIIHWINLNDGAQGSTIHWHGMYQTTTPWQDGVGGITQCHINPGTTWTYKFRADPFGSFWFHGHSGFNRDDGLWGAMIIHERLLPNAMPPYQHDNMFIHISDWFHDETEEHWLKHLAQEDILAGRGIEFNESLIFNGGLIGNNQIDLGQWWSQPGVPETEPITPGDHFNTVNDVREGHAFTVYNVVPGDTYRFRFIGAMFNTIARISFDDHPQVLVSQDAFDIAPVRDVESILIEAGERYDTLVTFNQPPDNYWVHVLMPQDVYNFDGIQHDVRALVHYMDDSVADPEDADFDPWDPNSDSFVTSIRDICTADAPCHIGNCYQLEYFPPHMVDGANEDCNDRGVCVGNGAITRCTHPGDNVNIALYDATRRQQFADIGNDGTYVDVGLPTQTVADAIHFLGFAFDRFINGIKWRQNSEPLLFAFVIPDPDNVCPTDSNGDQFCPAMDCHCTHMVEMEWNSVVDIVWFNMKVDVTQCGPNPCDPQTLGPADGSQGECGAPSELTECASDTTHPVHLHGHAFWILFEGKAVLDPVTGFPINNAFIDCDDDQCMEPHYRNGVLPPLNFQNPPQKDVIPLPPGGFIHARIHTNNPGAWPNHCHLENHLPTMMLEWRENHSGDFSDPKNFDVNRPPTLPRCGNFDPDSPSGIGPINPTTIPGETMVAINAAAFTSGSSNTLLPVVLVLAGMTLLFFSAFVYTCARLQQAQKGTTMKRRDSNTELASSTAYAQMSAAS